MLIFHTIRCKVYLVGYIPGLLLLYLSHRNFTWVSCVAVQYLVNNAGFHHCYTYILHSAPDTMSFRQIAMSFQIWSVLIPLAVEFYIRLNSTILK